MPVLNFFGTSPRRRASAMTAISLVAMITTVGSLPAQAADVTTTAGADPTRPPKAAEPIQTLTVSAEPTTLVEVDTFTITISAPGSAAAVAGSAAAAAAAAAEAAAAEAAAAEAAAAEAAAAAAEAAAAAAAPAAVPAPAAESAPAAAAAAAPAVQWPFSGRTRISDSYGPRTAPCSGCSTFHDGLDLTPGAGTPIGAIAGGVVSSVTPTDSGGLGVHVIVDHVVDGQKVTSTYGHMTVGSVSVAKGQSVTVGQKLGTVGSTGQSTGPHLHLEIYLGGVTAVDPYAWLTAHAGPM